MEADQKPTTGSRIKARRDEAGLLQDDLADLSNVSQGAISNIETGNRTRLYYDTTMAIFRALEAAESDPPISKDMPKSEMLQEIRKRMANPAPMTTTHIKD